MRPYTPESGGYIVLHKSQRKKNEANENIKTAKVLLPITASAIELGEAKSNESSIDSTLNAVPWEFKAIRQAKNIATAIQRQIERGKKKNKAHNILLHISQPYSLDAIISGLISASNEDKDLFVENIILVLQPSSTAKVKFYQFTREQIIKKEHAKILKGG